jgi:hypothetical protein
MMGNVHNLCKEGGAEGRGMGERRGRGRGWDGRKNTTISNAPMQI